MLDPTEEAERRELMRRIRDDEATPADLDRLLQLDAIAQERARWIAKDDHE